MVLTKKGKKKGEIFEEATVVTCYCLLQNLDATGPFAFHGILLVPAVQAEEGAFPWLGAQREGRSGMH